MKALNGNVKQFKTNIEQIQKDYNLLQVKYKAEQIKNQSLTDRINHLVEPLSTKLMSDGDKGNLVNNLILGYNGTRYKPESPRGKLVKDLKNLVNSRNTSSAFGKKWSLASRTDVEDELDPKIMQFLTTIHHTLDEFKFPSKIIWHKSKYYSVDNWKINVTDLKISELLMVTI